MNQDLPLAPLVDVLTRAMQKPSGALLATLVLYGAMLLLRTSSTVEAWFNTPARKRFVLFFMATAPAVIVILATEPVQWAQVISTVILNFFAATGMNRLVGINPKPTPADPSLKTSDLSPSKAEEQISDSGVPATDPVVMEEPIDLTNKKTQ